MLVAIAQFKISENREENLKKGISYIEKSKGKSDIVVLPELFLCPFELEYMKKNILTMESTEIQELKESARKNEITLLAGSILIEEEGKIFNRSLLINNKGEIEGFYDKRHPFTVDIKGRVRSDEGAIVSKGDNPFIFNFMGFKCGIVICYDIRFFDNFNTFEKEDVEVIFMPGAFNKYTGNAHWHTLGRARSIDYQSYMVMVSPSQNDDFNFKTYGHSLAIDPFGEILADLKEGEDIEIVEISKDRINSVRKNMLFRKQRKENL